MDSTYELTKHFHAVFKHPIEVIPGLPMLEMRKLRLRLILEEARELADAFGFMDVQSKRVWDKLEDDLQAYVREENCSKVSLNEAADALGDLDVVVNGAMLVCGIPGPELAQEIYNSNMSKLGEDGQPIMREDGKILKGPNYFPPDIDKVLREA